MGPKIIGFARTGLVEFSVDMALNNLKRKYWGASLHTKKEQTSKQRGKELLVHRLKSYNRKKWPMNGL